MSNAAKSNRIDERGLWVWRPRLRQQARLRLFCFPHAGGTTDIFAGWPELLGIDVEIALVQYPGRGQRICEPAFTDMKLLVDGLEEAIRLYDDLPFAFFGHSMGALVAFELSRRLQKHSLQPKHFFISACPAPQRLESRRLHAMENVDLINYLAAIGGTPPEVLQDRELVEIILPIVRADFQLIERYKFTHSSPLQIPISLCIGESDPKTNVEDIVLWSELFSAGHNARIFPGNHFYLKDTTCSLSYWLSANLGIE